METLCPPNHIQCSGTTCELLKKAGKGEWIRKREGMVEAKGKGQVQTYWILPKAASSSSAMAENGKEDNGGNGTISDDPYSPHGPNMLSVRIHEKQRLIDWHVELLSGHLRRIEARRQEFVFSTKRPLKDEDIDFHQKVGSSAVDEVTEVIKLPPVTDSMGRTMSARTMEVATDSKTTNANKKKKQQHQAKNKVHPESVVLDPTVVHQVCFKTMHSLPDDDEAKLSPYRISFIFSFFLTTTLHTASRLCHYYRKHVSRQPIS
jgi:hypothetical protein